MRYYGTITGLSVGGAAPAPAPGGDSTALGLLCVVGAVLVVGMIYLVTRALNKRGR